MLKTFFSSVLFSLIPFSSLASTPVEFIVEFIINGVEGNQGNVIIAMFDNEETWLDQPQALLLISRPATEAQNGQLVYKTNVSLPSTVSITAYQDIDVNNKLNKNFFGQPTEPYGFGNNVRHSTRAASFEEARITVLENSKIEIEIKK